MAVVVRSFTLLPFASLLKFAVSQPNVPTSHPGLSPRERPKTPRPTGTVSIAGLSAAVTTTARKPSAAKRSSRQIRERVVRRTVLVVDDVVDVTEMIALFLTHAGYEVTTANSADAALELTEGRHFDLVISDIGMPGINGYELAESLRSQTGYQSTP